MAYFTESASTATPEPKRTPMHTSFDEIIGALRELDNQLCGIYTDMTGDILKSIEEPKENGCVSDKLRIIEVLVQKSLRTAMDIYEYL